VRDLDDPSNPYAGQYSDWDKWIFDQAKEQAKTGNRRLPEGGKWYSAEVTNEGYVMPQLSALSTGLDRLRGTVPPSTEHCTHMISMTGKMDPAMEEQLSASIGRVWAERYPAIPAWLADAPALRSMVLPNGDVVTLGELGSGVTTGGKRVSGAQPYFRYSPEGEMLGQTLPGEMWQALYVKDWTAAVLLEQLKAKRLPRIERGCTVFFDRESNAVGAVYSFDGQALAPDSDLSQREPALITELTATQLADIFEAQGKLQLAAHN
jgi:hypothetical protein